MAIDRIVFATGPLRGRDGDRARRPDELGALLSARVGVPVETRQLERYRDLLAHLGDDVHLAWMAPALAVRAVARSGATMLASAMRDPGAHYHGTIFVRESSPWVRPDELRGTRIGWVDPDSCSGYLFPRMSLVLRGLAPDQLFKEQSTLGSHAAVARAVAERVVDAGATFMNVDAMRHDSGAVVTGWHDVTDEPMRPLLTTEPIPADAIVAGANVDEEMRGRIQAALVSLHDDRRGLAVVRHLFHAVRLEPANDRRYAVVRSALGPDL